ncbi:DUF4189 domain-containing protein [Xanthomonas hortorum]|uniref:DUF4189 domain-containing protein n=1 Tax=Xanthomonas hortorum TaxID=56454 RepID=UPI001E59AF27|nr:DUF4189 domain-containing protein [Xanthomonas hortorum]MCC8556294.1 DUF4189 domain-containing protein [Xanthomonas hortorum pv. gardneri]
MARYFCTLFLLLLLIVPYAAFGQTACPNGVAPGSPQCGPDSGTSRGDIVGPSPRPTGEWIKTWGAIAGSDSTGESGAVVGKLTREEAEKGAIRQCSQGGAIDCKVDLAYKNQCAALVGTSGRSFIEGASSEKKAVEGSMRDCSRYENDGSCKLLYSGCSDPIFKKY